MISSDRCGICTKPIFRRSSFDASLSSIVRVKGHNWKSIYVPSLQQFWEQCFLPYVFFLWEWWEFLIQLIHFYSKKASILVQITRGREITAAGFKQVDIYRTCASLHTNKDLCPKTLGRKKRIAKGTLYHAPSTTTAQISASCEEKL